MAGDGQYHYGGGGEGGVVSSSSFRASFKRRTDAIRLKFRAFGRARDLNHGSGSGISNSNSGLMRSGSSSGMMVNSNSSNLHSSGSSDDDMSKADATTTLLKRSNPSWKEDDQILSLNPTRSTEGETSMNSFVASSAAVLNSISDEAIDEQQENKASSSLNYRRHQSKHSHTKTRVIHPVICKRDIFLGHIDENEVDFGANDSLFPPPATARAKPKTASHHQQRQRRQSRDPPSSFGRTTTGKPDPRAAGEMNAFPTAADGSLGGWDEALDGMPFGTIREGDLFSSDNANAEDDDGFGGFVEDHYRNEEAESYHHEVSTLLSDSKIKAGAARVKRSILNSKMTTTTPNKVKALPPNTIMASMLFRTLDEEEKSYEQKPSKVRKKSKSTKPEPQGLHHNKLRMISEENQDDPNSKRSKTPKHTQVYNDDDESLFDFRECVPTNIREARSFDGSSVSSVTMYSTAAHDPIVRASSNLFHLLRNNNNNFAQFHAGGRNGTLVEQHLGGKYNNDDEYHHGGGDATYPQQDARAQGLFEA